MGTATAAAGGAGITTVLFVMEVGRREGGGGWLGKKIKKACQERRGEIGQVL